MPELPEVETVRRQISPDIVGQAITDVIITPGGVRMIGDTTIAKLKESLAGQTITTTSRHGKFMPIHLASGDQIVTHLRMSGRMEYTPKFIRTKHNRVGLVLGKGVLNFFSIRRFATFHYILKDQDYPGIAFLGPDALSDDFNGRYLADKLQDKTRPIYNSLMDQSVVAGLGNIYANETLFAAGIHPLSASGAISEQLLDNISTEAKRILNLALSFRGTTLIDKSFQDGTGSYGGFADKLKVYAKTGEVVSGHQVERTRLGGRSVFFVPEQQVLYQL